jgi:hypothetical protein
MATQLVQTVETLSAKTFSTVNVPEVPLANSDMHLRMTKVAMGHQVDMAMMSILESVVETPMEKLRMLM